MSRLIPVVHSVAVYDGQRHLGDVAEMGNGQFAAFDPDGEQLGFFDDRGAAARAVLDAASARA
jgi:hypothetical protein